MEPLIVFDAKKVMPNPFALAVAAAARARALRQGAQPRVNAQGKPGPLLALSEIAADAFAEEELAPFLPLAGAETPRLAPPEALLKVCDGRRMAAVAPIPAAGMVL